MRTNRKTVTGFLVAGVLALTGSAAGAAGTAGATTVATGAPVITNWYRIPAAHGIGRRTRSTWSSSNWSGYAETGHFTSVSGRWTVPSAAAGAADAGSTWYSSAWIGIDGFDNAHLIQTGTEQDYYGGTAHYSAWWEILPKAETVIPGYTVQPGDSMSATITQNSITVAAPHRKKSKIVTDRWTIQIQDVSAGWSFATTQVYRGQGSSAEFIVEAPLVGRTISTIADYAFPPASAAAGDFSQAGVATTLGAPLAGAGLNYQNDSGTLLQNGLAVSSPSKPDPASTAFNASYGATEPPAPTG